MKKLKLYADEDIEEGVVAVLRRSGVNITSARELGHRGKPDSFQAAFAYRNKRALLTKNAKHFLDDRAVPLNAMVAVIAIEGDFADPRHLARVLDQLLGVVAYGEIYAGCKIQISAERVIARFRADDGAMVTYQARLDEDGWVSEQRRVHGRTP